jgi:hypothetical protein
MPETKPDENGDKHTDIVWARIDAVVNLILENDRYFQAKRNKELCQTVMEKFAVEERQAQRYIREAKKEIKKIGQSDKQQAYIQAIRDREFLFSKAKQPFKDEQGRIIRAPDYEYALDVIKDRDRIKGLYIEQVQIASTVSEKADLTGIKTSDLYKLIEQLEKNIATESQSVSSSN